MPGLMHSSMSAAPYTTNPIKHVWTEIHAVFCIILQDTAVLQLCQRKHCTHIKENNMQCTHLQKHFQPTEAAPKQEANGNDVA